MNTEKSKMMRFGKRVKIGKVGMWKWREKVIEEVREYKYLGSLSKGMKE